MGIRAIIQQKLDNVLFKNGILSYHIRRVETDELIVGHQEINNDEYVVFRVISSKQGGYGDGKARLCRKYIDINYYYKYDKNDVLYDEVEKRVDEVKKEFLKDKRFILVNDKSDLPDIDSPYRGINIELLFIGALKDVKND